ncbi:hypothetical protein [Nonomuraea basaltis]|uniref:hypothetical protein n=1 Tax=Nonomuraea basaltis TaxID=2495887 RepID=UPI001486D088|nr:hypothetical protein [Nonomuraea basaltis]
MRDIGARLGQCEREIAQAAALRQIMDSPLPQRRRLVKRRLITGTVVTALAIVIAIVVAPADLGGMRIGPDSAHALSFTKNGDYIDVRIVDPSADPQRFRDEFAAHGLDVDLKLWAASPSVVGTIISATVKDGRGPQNLEMLESAEGPGRCGNLWCKGGVRIPVNHRGRIELIFGRAAGPGEKYEIQGDPTAQGEIFAGLDLRNRSLAEVKAMARERNATIARLFQAPPENPSPNDDAWLQEDHELSPVNVPDTWYVHEGITSREPGSVDLVVAPWKKKGPRPIPAGDAPIGGAGTISSGTTLSSALRTFPVRGGSEESRSARSRP